jgi:hypothetical protein
MRCTDMISFSRSAQDLLSRVTLAQMRKVKSLRSELKQIATLGVYGDLLAIPCRLVHVYTDSHGRVAQR